jgi:hypothetical protein
MTSGGVKEEGMLAGGLAGAGQDLPETVVVGVERGSTVWCGWEVKETRKWADPAKWNLGARAPVYGKFKKNAI